MDAILCRSVTTGFNRVTQFTSRRKGAVPVMNPSNRPASAGPGPEYKDCRRSQRVQLILPVIVRGSHRGAPFEEEASTVCISANGCLIRMRRPLDRAQIVSLMNPRTSEEMLCRVVYLGKQEHGKTEVGMEFSEPSPVFWRVTFPPSDWNPKERKLPTHSRLSPGR